MAKLIIRTEGAPVEILELQPGIHRIGRSPESDFEVCHASVSSQHCEIELRAEGLFVRDLDSTNGTFVDDQLVTEETLLQSGQQLRLGKVVCEVHDAAAEVTIPSWGDPEPTPLPDGAVPCANHPSFHACMRCTECQKVFCGTCVHILRRTNGRVLRLCPACSGQCEPMEAVGVAGQGKTFMDFLKKTFRMPKLKKRRRPARSRRGDTMRFKR